MVCGKTQTPEAESFDRDVSRTPCGLENVLVERPRLDTLLRLPYTSLPARTPV